jgi:hypothetical protein
MTTRRVFDMAIQRVRLHVRAQLRKFAVGDGVESFTRREVMIDGHGGNAHAFGDTANGDGVGPFFPENGESHGSVIGTHDLYSV